MTLENGFIMFKILHVTIRCLKVVYVVRDCVFTRKGQDLWYFYVNYGILCISIWKVRVTHLDSQEVLHSRVFWNVVFLGIIDRRFSGLWVLDSVVLFSGLV